MAALTGNYPMANQTYTMFNTWAQAISTAFSTFGWVQTTDTGQTNWTTNTTAPNAGAVQYQCWRTNDALSTSAYPIVVRICCGATPTGTNYPNLYLQVGFGTILGGGSATTFAAIANPSPIMLNAGNLNNQTNGSSFECNFSGDSGRFQMIMWRGYISAIYSIERSVNTSGATTGDYLVALTGGGYTYNNSIFYPTQQILFAPGNSIWGSSSPLLPAEFGWTALHTNNSSAIVNGTMNVGWVFPYTGASFGNPVLGAVCTKAADLADDTQFSATAYGTAHTYLTVNTPAVPSIAQMVSRASTGGQATYGSGANAIAIRYE